MLEYFNQTITKRSVNTVNQYNEKAYTTTTIRGRFIYQRKLYRNDLNEEIMSNAIIYTSQNIVEGDIIVYDGKDWKVRFVYPHVNLDGSISFYKGVL